MSAVSACLCYGSLCKIQEAASFLFPVVEELYFSGKEVRILEMVMIYALEDRRYLQGRWGCGVHVPRGKATCLGIHLGR